MAINTPQDLIKIVLKTAGIVGIGQTPAFEDVNDTFDNLNLLVAKWSRERWYCYSLNDIAFTATGQQSYAIGPGAPDIDTVRPNDIESAYVRLLLNNNGPAGEVDLPLMVIQSREDYSQIVLKSLQTIPYAIWMDTKFPWAYLYPYPVPQGGNQYEVHVVVKNTISAFPSLTSQLNLPPEYIEALLWSMVVRIRPYYQLPVDPVANALMETSLNVLTMANTQISHLTMPPGTPGMGRGRYPWHGIRNSGFF